MLRKIFLREPMDFGRIEYKHIARGAYVHMKPKIGQNIKKARELRGFEQKDLAEAIGLVRQSISDIELGKREVKALELYAIARFLHVSPASILDQDSSESEEAISVLWRQKPTRNEKASESKFVAKCEEYCWIEQLVFGSNAVPKIASSLPNVSIDLNQFTCNHAYDLAESIRREMSLGDFPASQLMNVLEEFYDVKFIVDDECEASAASSRSHKGSFTLINGKNVEPRQHFSVAHELFHLITWSDKLLHLVKNDKNLHKKNEQLADAFAAGLLIPQEKLRAEMAQICAEKNLTAADIFVLAEQFRVSSLAMLYRIWNLKLINKIRFEEIKNQLPVNSLSISSAPLVHRLRSKFVRLVYLAYERAQISRAKAAKLLGVDLSDLSDHFQEYDLMEMHGQ